MNEIVTSSLRILTLISKFLFSIYLTKCYGINIVGIYGLTSSIISLFVYLAGCELYSILTPSYNKNSKIDSLLFSNQIFFSIISTLLLSFTTLFIIIFYFSTYIYICVFIIIIIAFEIFQQEIYRILLIKGKVLTANIAYFIRNGLWCYIFIVFSYLMNLDEKIITTSFLLTWGIVGLLGSIFSYLVIKRENVLFKYNNIRKRLIVINLKKAFPIFLSSIFIRVIVTSDKIILGLLTNLHQVGIYTFFISIGNAYQALIDAGAISHKYKEIINVSKKNDLFKLKYILSYISKISIFLYFFSILSSIIFFYIFNFNEYLNNILSLFIILLSSTLFSFGNVTKLYLASQRKTKEILYSSIFSIFIFIIMVILGFLLGGDIIIMSINLMLCSIVYTALSLKYIYDRSYSE
ncbi:oligosaccharide flippase family protein [Proteus terrae]|uniref:oligosaccharide flippase family protein n=1 Tax=Proteus terrae TaxID=1574161 RepID=UPI003526716F